MTISERGAIWYLLDLSIHLDYLSGNRSVTPIGWDCERYCERCRREKGESR